MNIYINKIRDLIIDCMPRHWYKCYLFFECTESGMSSAIMSNVNISITHFISYKLQPNLQEFYLHK